MPVTVRGTDILFNDGSTQSTAAGGVPAYGAVGSIVIAFVQMTAQNFTWPEGTTFAGSGLRRTPDSASNSIFTDVLNICYVADGSGITYSGFWNNNVSLGLSGTWRSLTRVRNANVNYSAGSLSGAVLLQRIS